MVDALKDYRQLIIKQLSDTYIQPTFYHGIDYLKEYSKCEQNIYREYDKISKQNISENDRQSFISQLIYVNYMQRFSLTAGVVSSSVASSEIDKLTKRQLAIIFVRPQLLMDSTALATEFLQLIRTRRAYNIANNIYPTY